MQIFTDLIFPAHPLTPTLINRCSSYFNMVYRCAYQAKVAVSTSVYDKSLRLAGANRGGTSLGELVNLMQVDATKIEMFIPQFHVLWDGVIQIIGFMTILYTLIGWVRTNTPFIRNRLKKIYWCYLTVNSPSPSSRAL